MIGILLRKKRKYIIGAYEPCIVCGIITDVPRSRHVEEREGYIRGCGQTCPDCFRELHKDKTQSCHYPGR